MTGAHLILDLMKQEAEKLPPAVRTTIETAAVETQHAAGLHRGPAERQRVRDFIREVEAAVTVDRILRRDHPRTHPTRADLKPLQDIAGALDTIDAALRTLRDAPTGDHWDWEVALDVGVRVRCYQRKLGAERFGRHRKEIDQAIDDALTGGAVDAYLPEGPSVYSLRWFLDALRASVAEQESVRARLPGCRPLNERNQHLANDLAMAFVSHLDCPLLIGQSPARPFLRVLRAIFDSVNITGKNGQFLSDSALADYARRAAPDCPFTVD